MPACLGGLMETKNLWARTLKALRDNGEDFVLGAIANLSVSFTHDTIILHANKSIAALIQKRRDMFPENLVIRMPTDEKPVETIEQKLFKLFGKKLEIKNEHE
jgi:hypothetical protein